MTSGSGIGLDARGARYAATIIAGFGIDLATGLLLARVLDLPLPLAASAGFLVALVFNYLLFELWVFEGADGRLSARRLLRTALAASLALGVRIIVVWLMGRLLGSSLAGQTLALVAGAGASVLANYFGVRRIFARA